MVVVIGVRVAADPDQQRVELRLQEIGRARTRGRSRPSYFSVMLTGALVRSPEWAMRDTFVSFLGSVATTLPWASGELVFSNPAASDRLSIGKHGETVDRKPRGRTQRVGDLDRIAREMRSVIWRHDCDDRRQSGADRLCFIAPFGGRVSAADRFGLVARLAARGARCPVDCTGRGTATRERNRPLDSSPG